MTLLSAPTRARRDLVESRQRDPHAPPPRVPHRLRDGTTLAIAAAVRKGRPRISDDELEAVLQGFERISREAGRRAEQAREIEAMHAPKAALLSRLERVDAALIDLAGASADERAAAVSRLSSVVGELGPVLRPHGLSPNWRADAVQHPQALRNVVATAMRGAGAGGGRLAAARKEAREAEAVRVQSAAAELWRSTFDASRNVEAPDNFGDLAQRAIVESRDDAVAGGEPGSNLGELLGDLDG